MQILKQTGRTAVICIAMVAVFFTMGLFTGEVDAATYKLSKKKATVYMGSKVKLKVLTKSGRTTKKKVTWKSSNKKVATVSKYGNIKGKKKGKVKIYAKVGKKTYKCTVAVKKAPQKINKKTAAVKAGQAVSLKMQNLKKEKVKGKYKKPKVAWSSSNKAVASVSSSGKVTTKKQGKAKITAKVGKKKKKYSCTVTVKYPNYTINTKSTPIKTSFKSYSGYTSKSRQYYTIRSYLEVFETAGGGTLTLSKGTYNITNTLYIPSNVTIKMSNGTTVKKSTDTGTSSLKASKSIFQLCAPSKAKVANNYSKGKYKYGYTGYNGVKNVGIYGYGTAVINNNNIYDSLSLIMGHNKNITINNIIFKNMNYGHFIEANSSSNVNITNCTFRDGVGSNKEAVNIDTPDLVTNGFNSPWSSFDRTPCNNVAVKSCSFLNMPTSVGSHRYSEGKPHTNISVIGCTIRNMSNNGINAMNWKNSSITDCTIDGIIMSGSYRAIKCGGTVNLTVKNNYFNNMLRVAQFYTEKLNGFAPIKCDMSESCMANFIAGGNTYGSNIVENFIRINEFMKEDGSGADFSKYIKLYLDGSPCDYVKYPQPEETEEPEDSQQDPVTDNSTDESIMTPSFLD